MTEPTNSLDTDKSVMLAYTINVMEGGMIGPRIAAIPEICRCEMVGVAFLLHGRMVVPPTADAVATPEPEIAPNSADASTVTTPESL